MRTFVRGAALVWFAITAACGGKYQGATTPTPTSKLEPSKFTGSIENAALPYQVLERKGSQIDDASFWTKLATARAVCVGEEHPNPHHHWVQLHVVRELAKRLAGAKLAVGLEMVQRPFQAPLDDYAAKRIDAAALQSRTGWAERWGYEFSLYGPTLDAAIAAGGALIALNAPKELVKKITRGGIESLTADEKRQLPELKLDDANHRAWFEALMSDMGGTAAHSGGSNDSKPDDDNPHTKGPSAERIYMAQVLWDESMADGSARWLKDNPTGKLVILAGNGHCHDSAIIGRMKRRGIGEAVSIRVVIEDGQGSVGDVLAKPMHDYVVVLSLPKTATK